MNRNVLSSKINLVAALSATACVALLVTCDGLDLAGGGADIGNPQKTASVRGRAVYENSGTPAVGASVIVRDSKYVRAIEDSARPVLVDARCDDSGSFRIDSIVPGVYFLEIISGNGFAALERCAIVDSTTRIDLGRTTIKPVGTIRGVMPAELSVNRSWYAQIFGMDRIATVNPRTGAFLFPDLPEGAFTIRLMPTGVDIAPITIDTVKVRSGTETVVSSYPQWSFSKALKLNTTITGADVKGTVTGFPVLIRLTASNFNFGQAKSGGEDIRFTKSDGAPLSYEIERWDPVTGLAEVWVNVDTVYGNDSAQSITMYWGNPNSFDKSNGEAVFDTANGFQGVWHLNENGDSVYDATANAFHGANSGSITAAGIIGNSRKFADGNYLKISGLLNSPSNVTLSAWVLSDKSTGGQDVISIGDAVMIRLDYFGGKGASGWYHNSPITSDDSKYAIDSSGRYLANTGWHYLTYAINGETHVQTLYIDGVQTVTINDTNPIYYAGLGADTYIGIHGNGKTTYNFGGQIDEVRVIGIAESPDWIKLCFMNQKATDALVKW